jgi:hypothetical protein
MNRLVNVDEICRPAFAGLEVLDLGNNKIKEIPVAFVHFLRNLGNLCLVNNDLSYIPNLLGFHKNLHTLQLDGNPLKAIRRQVLDKGTNGIMEYLKDKYIQGKDDLIEPWAI